MEFTKTCRSSNQTFRRPLVLWAAAAVVLVLAMCTNHHSFAWPPKKPMDGERSPSSETAHLSDGFFVVLQTSDRRDAISTTMDRQAIVRADRSDADGQLQAQFLLINSDPDVPLRLANAPSVVIDQSDRKVVNLRLTVDCRDQVARVTTDNADGSVALIVNSEIVAVLKIRGPIMTEEIQISSCSDGAIEHLTNLLKERSNKSNHHQSTTEPSKGS